MSNSFKNRSVISLFLAALLSLTACGGGGGGGGGGGLPTRVNVVFPQDDDAIDETSADFEIAFTTAVTSGLVVTLNGVDVTALFPGTSTANRKTSVYSLSGILTEGTNYFNAKVGNSVVSGVSFTYDATPEIILTEMTGALSDTLNGLTRKATLDSVTVNTSLFATIAGGQSFSLASVVMPAPGTAVTTTPDFTIVATDAADGDVETATIIVPESVIKYGAAVQLNQSAFTGVIKDLVGDLIDSNVQAQLADYVATPLPHASTADLTVTGYNPAATPVLLEGADGCELVNIFRATPVDFCKLYITDITPGTGTPEVTILNNNYADGFGLSAKVTFDTLDVTVDTTGFSDSGYTSYIGAFVTTMTFTNVSFLLNLDISQDTGIVTFKLPPIDLGDTRDTFVLDMGSSLAVGTTVCTIPALCDSTPVFGTIVKNQMISILETQITDQLVASTLITTIEDKLTAFSVSNQTIIAPVKDVTDTQISSLNFGFSGSEVTEAISTGVVGGFIAVGGSNYSSDTNDIDFCPTCDGTNDIPVLGSYFDPLAATEITNKLLSTTNNAVIALSENSLNQLLASVYTSRLLTTEQAVFTVGDLAEFGDEIIAATADTYERFGGTNPLLDRRVYATDLISIDFDLNAVPYSRFIAPATLSGPSGLELRLNAFDASLTIYRECADTGDVGTDITTNECTPFYKTAITDMDAKMLMDFSLANKLPSLAINDSAIDIVGGVVNTFLQPTLQTNKIYDHPDFGPIPIADVDAVFRAAVDSMLNSDGLEVTMQSVLGTFVTGFAADLIDTIVKNQDEPGLFAEDKSVWVILETLKVDAQNEFVLLGASVSGTAPALPNKAIFQLNITDCTARPTGEFCPCDGVNPEPAGCPVVP